MPIASESIMDICDTVGAFTHIVLVFALIYLALRRSGKRKSTDDFPPL